MFKKHNKEVAQAKINHFTIEDLGNQLEETHKKGVKFECFTCKKKFDRSTALEKHIQKHKPKNIKNEDCCGICQIYLNDRSSLRRHKKTQHVE